MSQDLSLSAGVLTCVRSYYCELSSVIGQLDRLQMTTSPAQSIRFLFARSPYLMKGLCKLSYPTFFALEFPFHQTIDGSFSAIIIK